MSDGYSFLRTAFKTTKSGFQATIISSRLPDFLRTLAYEDVS